MVLLGGCWITIPAPLVICWFLPWFQRGILADSATRWVFLYQNFPFCRVSCWWNSCMAMVLPFLSFPRCCAVVFFLCILLGVCWVVIRCGYQVRRFYVSLPFSFGSFYWALRPLVVPEWKCNLVTFDTLFLGFLLFRSVPFFFWLLPRPRVLVLGRDRFWHFTLVLRDCFRFVRCLSPPATGFWPPIISAVVRLFVRRFVSYPLLIRPRLLVS